MALASSSLSNCNYNESINELTQKSTLSEDDVNTIKSLSPHNIQQWITDPFKNTSVVQNLKFLLILHDIDFMQITTYIKFCPDIDKFIELLLLYITSSNEYQISTVSDVINIIISVQPSVSVFDACCSIVEKIIEHISSTVSSNTLHYNKLIHSLQQSKYKMNFILENFLFHILHETLQNNDHVNESLDNKQTHSFAKNNNLTNLILRQKDIFNNINEHGLFRFYKQIFNIISIDELYLEIEDYFIKDNTNWSNYLLLISAYLHCDDKNIPQDSEKYQNVSKIIDFIENNFKQNLSQEKIVPLINCIILIRQLCFEQIKPNYVSYSYWFSNLQIKSKKQFQYFFYVLTEIVPHENAIHLKIHINKAPQIPLNCQNIFSDYVQLAKTKLTDMNETIEYLGLFGTTDYNDRLEDVRKVLSHFELTNQIADIVLKVSVIRREYYQEIFLKDLLNFNEEKYKSIQIQFVQKLYNLGKMSSQFSIEEWQQNLN